MQIVGAATSIEQLDALCAQSKTANGVSRLRASGYNIPILTKVICAGAAAPALPSLDLIRELVAEVSTQIWIVQAIGAVTGPQGVQNLCNWINVEAANAIGLVGDLVKKDVCAAATTVARVRNTNMPASLALKSPIVDPLAPLKEIVLNFVPVASSEE